MWTLPLAAENIVKQLNMEKLKEGVYAKRSYDGPALEGGRAGVSSAYAVVAWTAPSYLHRLDCDELWHFYAGHSLDVHVLEETGFRVYRMGPDIAAGENPEVILPKGTIFGALAAKPTAWCLFGCVCIPGFEFSGCEYITANHPALDGYTGEREILARLTEYK